MRTLLFGVLAGPDLDLLEKNREYIDGVELRLDLWRDLSPLKEFMQKCAMPVMLTLRKADQGGSFKGSEQERLAILESLCELGPAYIDLEYDVPAAFRKKLFEAYPLISFLCSYHNFEGTPDLDAVYERIKTPHAHIHKISSFARSPCDALRMLHFVQAHSLKHRVMGICMGELGQASRIMAPCTGGAFMYASLSEDAATAPGQVTARELDAIYRFKQRDRQTAVYALLGDPVDKSLGHIVHNDVFEKRGLNALYLKIPVPSAELVPFLKLARQLPFRGFSVTMPHKEAIVPFLERVSPEVEAIGACNTIKVEDRKWIGYNTDGAGALDALEKREMVRGKRCVFLGAGGAAKALVYEAAKRGAVITILNRTPEKAVELAKGFGGRGGGLELMPEVCKEGYDALINCSPDSEWLDEKWILPEILAMDIVYVPKNTPFLVKAMKKKCRIVYGYEMFAGQAALQQQIWYPGERVDGLIQLEEYVK